MGEPFFNYVSLSYSIYLYPQLCFCPSVRYRLISYYRKRKLKMLEIEFLAENCVAKGS